MSFGPATTVPDLFVTCGCALLVKIGDETLTEEISGRGGGGDCDGETRKAMTFLLS